MGIRVKVRYEDKVLKPLEELDLKEGEEVEITISRGFRKLLEEVGEIEAKEDTDKVLRNMRTKDYYG